MCDHALRVAQSSPDDLFTDQNGRVDLDPAEMAPTLIRVDDAHQFAPLRASL